MLDSSQAANLVIPSDMKLNQNNTYGKIAKEHQIAASTLIGTQIPSTTRKIPIVKSRNSDEDDV